MDWMDDIESSVIDLEILDLLNELENIIYEDGK